MALNPYEKTQAELYDLVEYKAERGKAISDIETWQGRLRLYPSHYSDEQKKAINNQIQVANRYLNMSAKDLEANYQITPNGLDKAIQDRRDDLKILKSQYPPAEERPVGTPLKDTVATVFSPQSPEPSPRPEGLTPAQILARTRDRRGVEDVHQTPQAEKEQREWSQPHNVTPLKETLNAISPERTPPPMPVEPYVNPYLTPSAPPPPTFGQWAQEKYQGVVDAVQRRLPYTPESPKFGQQLEQPAVGERQNLPSFEQWGQQQRAQHEQEFYRQLDQYYEKQPPSQPTPAPRQPGHLKDLYSKEQGQSGQPISYEEKYKQVSAQHAQQLHRIEQSVQQLNTDVQTPQQPGQRKEFDIRATLGLPSTPPGGQPPAPSDHSPSQESRYEEMYRQANQRHQQPPPDHDHDH